MIVGLNFNQKSVIVGLNINKIDELKLSEYTVAGSLRRAEIF